MLPLVEGAGPRRGDRHGAQPHVPPAQRDADQRPDPEAAARPPDPPGGRPRCRRRPGACSAAPESATAWSGRRRSRRSPGGESPSLSVTSTTTPSAPLSRRARRATRSSTSSWSALRWTASIRYESRSRTRHARRAERETPLRGAEGDRRSARHPARSAPARRRRGPRRTGGGRRAAGSAAPRRRVPAAARAQARWRVLVDAGWTPWLPFSASRLRSPPVVRGVTTSSPWRHPWPRAERSGGAPHGPGDAGAPTPSAPAMQ